MLSVLTGAGSVLRSEPSLIRPSSLSLLAHSQEPGQRVETSYGPDDRRFVVPFLAGQEVVFCSKASRPPLVSIQLPIRTALEGDHSSPSSAQLGPQLDCTICCHGLHKESPLRMVRSHGNIAVIQIKGGMGGSQFTYPHFSLYLYIAVGRHT